MTEAHLLQEITGSKPIFPEGKRRKNTGMKVDIHNHILPKEWPDLKQVGTDSTAAHSGSEGLSEQGFLSARLNCFAFERNTLLSCKT